MSKPEKNIAKLRSTSAQVQVSDTRPLPFRAICHLDIFWVDGQNTPATGVLFADRTVITVAHNLYRRDGYGWATRIRVSPGANGPIDLVPPIDAGPRNFTVHDWWYSGSDLAANPNDLGCIWLPTGSTRGIGWTDLTYAADPAALRDANMTSCGYPATREPGDKVFLDRTMWLNHGKFGEMGYDGWFYSGFAQGGLSGAPIWLSHQIPPYTNTIALHKGFFTPSGSTERKPFAMRLAPEHHELIRRWIGMAKAPLTPSIETDQEVEHATRQPRAQVSDIKQGVEAIVASGKHADYDFELGTGETLVLGLSCQATSPDAPLGRCTLEVRRKNRKVASVELFVNTSGRRFNKQTLDFTADQAGPYVARITAHGIALRAKLKGK